MHTRTQAHKHARTHALMSARTHSRHHARTHMHLDIQIMQQPFIEVFV